MKLLRICLLVSAAFLSCVIAGCQSPAAINGSGYQFVKFKDPKAAVLASQDESAGPSIDSNNRQCQKDKACRK